MKLSPTQQKILEYLTKGPPGIAGDAEGVARAMNVKVSTVYNQLARIRKKDWEARSFHGKLNSLIGAYPQIARYLKVRDGRPFEDFDRHTQIHEPLQSTVEERRKKIGKRAHISRRRSRSRHRTGKRRDSDIRRPRTKGRFRR